MEKTLQENGKKQELDRFTQTRILVCDLDDSLFGKDKGWGDDTTKASIEILNQLIAYAAENKSTEIIPTLLTARPASVFLVGDSPLRWYINTGKDTSKYMQHNGIDGLGVVACEYGAVMLTPTVFPDDDNPMNWHMQVAPQYKNYVDTIRPKILEVLRSKFVDTGLFQFEKGNEVKLALQKKENISDTARLTDDEKQSIKTEIENALREGGHEASLDEIVIDTSGHDVDILPKSLFEDGKLIGLNNIMSHLKRDTFNEATLANVIMLDDSFIPVQKAFRAVAEGGGKIITPAKHHSALDPIMKEHGGYISQYEVFLGALDGIWFSLFNENLGFPWVDNNTKKPA